MNQNGHGKVQVVLVEPGATDFDEQGRIKGSLDMPLSTNGTSQVVRTVEQLADLDIQAVYSAPCRSAVQTAQRLAQRHDARLKTLKNLRNVDHGLWHGTLIDDLRRRQPKAYRQWQVQPNNVCPPEGETLVSARKRVAVALAKVFKKHKNGILALVVPEPLAAVVRNLLAGRAIEDIWKSECDQGSWELLEVDLERLAVSV